MDAGLCATCRHCQLIDTARSRFFLCGRSFDDPRFRKYPVLPVSACDGHECGEPTMVTRAPDPPTP